VAVFLLELGPDLGAEGVGDGKQGVEERGWGWLEAVRAAAAGGDGGWMGGEGEGWEGVCCVGLLVVVVAVRGGLVDDGCGVVLVLMLMLMLMRLSSGKDASP
jgi:hypothetical protein